jgi:low temperature requirement protein LtrA
VSEITALPSPDALPERRTSPLELLWDLVFVFAITQVTTLLSAHLSPSGLGQSMLVLALIWWAWSAFVWAANAQPGTSGSLRACLLLASVFILIAGLAVPNAFGSAGRVFAVAYAVVRMLHLALYADASRHGHAAWTAIAGFAVTVVIGMALLIAGSFFPAETRGALWLAAAAIDYAGPAWLTRKRLRGLQSLAVAHFAERYSLFVIICLGESIVAIGVGARHQALSVELVAAVALGLLITIGLWWTYFDRSAEDAERRLRTHDDPVLTAADAYSYLHLVIVAGIIIFAVGASAVIHAVSAPLAAGARLSLCGGVAVYLLGLVAFRLRMLAELSWVKLLVAAALFGLFAIGGPLPAWSLEASITALLVVACAAGASAPEGS